MDLQRKSSIAPVESCPHWLKITLWKELGLLVQKYGLLFKNIFPNMLSNTSLDFILDMVVIDPDNIIDIIENKKRISIFRYTL